MKCVLTTKKGTQCTRNAVTGNYCAQHSKVITPQKDAKLIPVLENIVSEYNAPYDYFKLITKNSTIYTIKKYEILQKNFETKIAETIKTEFDLDVKNFTTQILNDLKVQKEEEIFRLKMLGTALDVSLNYEREKMRETFLDSYKYKLINFMNNYMKKLSDALRDANIFEATGYKTALKGLPLKEFIKISPIRSGKMVIINFKNGGNLYNPSYFEITVLLKKPKQILYEINGVVSPLWYLYMYMVKTKVNIWSQIIGTTGFSYFVAPR